MGLLQYLITEGKREVMIDKIGISERMADWITNHIDKKFQIWFANYVKIYRQEFPEGEQYDMDRWFKYEPSYEPSDPDDTFKTPYNTAISKGVSFLIRIVKNPDLPTMDLKQFKGTLRVYQALDDYPTVIDYIEATNVNVQGMEWEDLVEEAQTWHERIAQGEDVGTGIELQGDMEVIHKFDDGYYWVDVHDSSCQLEGNSMGHCGRTSADTLLSLRSPDNEPHVTVAWDYDDQVYRQMKGKGNRKPVEKYHPYIHWLFTNDGEYQIKGYKHEQDSSEDFRVDDLPEDLKEEVLTKYPSIDPAHYIRKIINDDTYTEKQKFELLKDYDEETNFFGGELSEFELNDEDRIIVSEDVDMIDLIKKDDNTFEWIWSIMRREDHLYFDNVDGGVYIDYIDFDKYPYESEQMQYLLNLAKEDDPDRYQEVIETMQEDFEEPYEEVIKNDSRYLEEFLEKLYEEEFDKFNRALDRVATWAYESQAMADMEEDLLQFIKDTPFESQFVDGEVLDWQLEYKHEGHLLGYGNTPINITLDLGALIQIFEDNPDFADKYYLTDYIRPYSFAEKMNEPYYGYPTSGIDSKNYNDTFHDAIYE